ncbi:MAG: CDP-diacylglycerol--glycerol-3-phosphate 3-phosphatidyltransferase [Spirochaetia bacterium]|nr:CDP-diacylglycerol--glycerol-3-phosphate 3-phosphatidyltransferase [Spirochaetia bacterium]
MKLQMITIPNILTVMRLIIIPFFLFFIFRDNPASRLIAVILFIIAAVSDFLDGYLARKLSQDSKFGRFLDPLADKMLVIATLLAFTMLDNQVSMWMVITIIGRDMIVTLMRYLAIRKGTELKTSRLGKTKTALQMTAIIMILLILFVRSYRFDVEQIFLQGHQAGKKNIEIALDLMDQAFKLLPNKEINKRQKSKIFLEPMPYFLMLITTIVTLISGLRYVYTNFKVLLPPYYLFFPKQKGKDD